MNPKSFSHFLIATFFLLSVHAFAAGPYEDQDWGAEAHAILKKNCFSCHGAPGKKVRGGFDAVLDFEHLRKNPDYIDLENPLKSYLYERILSDEMPIGNQRKLSLAEKNVILTWIENGAPSPLDEVAPLATTTASYSYLVDLVAQDLRSFSEEKRKDIRYLSIAHMPPSGDSEADIEIFRDALTKLANSLSLAEEMYPLQAIDEDQLVFRVDLKALRWRTEIWEKIGNSNPYAVSQFDEESRFIRSQTGSSFPFIRGDWFALEASKPPLYYEFLEIPQSDSALERDFIGIDVTRNVEERRVIRAGFTNSGVSQNNRMIERHRSRFGSYWKSYDFEESTGTSDIFSRPLGPVPVGLRIIPKSTQFKHAGGEIIFSLPNGLQGYMLTNEQSQRLDEAPIEIVQDTSKRDSTIVNGISCISCHAQGMRRKNDQIRGYVEINKNLFDPQALEEIFATYRGNDTLNRAFEEDEERFMDAMKRAGVKNLDPSVEPVRFLVERFEKDVSLKRAAAELGIDVAKLIEKAQDNSTMQGILYRLRSPHGVPRSLFIEFFRELHTLIEFGQGSSGNPILGLTNVLGMSFSQIPSGQFLMGSDPNGAERDVRQNDEQPHVVRLTHGFEMQKTETTQSQWESIFPGQNPSKFKGPNRPVEMVSWWSTLVFTNELSKKIGFPACYQIDESKCEDKGKAGIIDDAGSGTLSCQNEALSIPTGSVYKCQGFRLPTEAEWEYAARAGSTGAYFFDKPGEYSPDQLLSYAWFFENSGNQTHDVATAQDGGSAETNAFGLHDVHGNVWEWVYDFIKDYPNTSEANPDVNPEGLGSSGSIRVFRGGSRLSNARYLRSADRNFDYPDIRSGGVGFRPVRTLH